MKRFLPLLVLLLGAGLLVSLLMPSQSDGFSHQDREGDAGVLATLAIFV
jgi:hypothetical protein